MWQQLFRSLGFEAIKEAWQNRWRRRQPVPKPPQTSKPSGNTIEYLINDPTTPNLVRTMTPPTPPSVPVYTVRDYKGAGYSRNSVEGQAANCFVTLADTLNYFKSQTDRPLQKWVGTSNLSVIPRAGNNLNAYYDRAGLRFFYYTHKAIGGTVYTCESSDIVAHELGHAIFDSYRPDTWNAASVEIAAFHESFGDITSILHLMLYDEVLNHVIQHNDADLRQMNVIAQVAEQFGRTINKLTGRDAGNYLRCAINNFTYSDPATLPADTPDELVSSECHNFSRIFTGAFYDILVMVYEDIRSTGVPALEALKGARDTLARYMIKAIQNCPINVRFYESMAKTMLWADVTLNNWKYHDRMREIFLNRKIMTPQVKILSAPAYYGEDNIVRTTSKLSLKLSDFLIRAQSNDNPLYSVEVEIPTDGVYLYDNNKNLYDVIRVSEEESVGAAETMINHLHQTNSVSDSPDTPFEVRDGKLLRTHFVCGCCR